MTSFEKIYGYLEFCKNTKFPKDPRLLGLYKAKSVQ